jgi:hypothetical protein
MTVVVSDEEKACVTRQVGIRKASVSEPLLTCRNHEMASKPERWRVSGMSLAGARLLARWCPACRWREPGLRLLHGTWEGRPRHCRPVGWGGERERPEAETVGTEYRRVGVLADRLVVVGKLL